MSSRSAIIRVRNSTHMLVGWYRPDEVDPLGLRATEIKGLWRWWARAFVAGALYELGYLKGVGDDIVYLKPTQDEAKTISIIVGAQLGLGYVIGNRSEASRFSLFVKPLSDIANLRVSSSAMQQYQRVRLLSLKGSVYAIMRGGEFDINVSWNSSHKGLELALKILIIALQLNGIGKGGRRGLGSLDIIDINLPFNFDRNIVKLVEHTYRECKELVQDVVEKPDKYDVPKLRQSASQDLPPLPVVSKRSVNIKLKRDGMVEEKDVQVTEFYVIDSDFNKFIDVDNFFVRSERCKKLLNNAKCYDDLRKHHYAWFLGLPRSQKETGGYVIIGKDDDRKVIRRASPIHIAFHDAMNMFGKGIFMTILLSGDWPRHIRWFAKGRHRRRSTDSEKTISIDSSKIVNAYGVFINEFRNYLQVIGLNLGARSWP